jgi:hypothetical protein
MNDPGEAVLSGLRSPVSGIFLDAMEDECHGRRMPWKTNAMEDECLGRRMPWKTNALEDERMRKGAGH